MFEYLAPSELQHLSNYNNNLIALQGRVGSMMESFPSLKYNQNYRSPARATYFNNSKRNQTNLLNASAIAAGTGMDLPASALKQTNTDLPLV